MLSLILSLLFALPGYSYTMKGEIDVSRGALRVKRDDGFKVRFYKGKYKTDLTAKRGKLYLRIERKGIITDVTANNVNFPENGSFDLTPSQLGQTFSMSGQMTTDVQQTDIQQGTESCIYYEEEYVCRGEGIYRECNWEDVPYRGSRDIEFYDIVKTRTLVTTFTSPNVGSGDFSGTKVSRNRINTYEGECF